MARYGKCMWDHPLRSCWDGIKRRCFNTNSIDYPRYGGRGITMHEEWRNDFTLFHAYVTQLPHYGEEGMTLDRIDNDGNYVPGNVRWIDRTIQAVNQRRRSNNSGYTGVFHDVRSDAYVAHITVNYHRTHIGTFSNPKDAVRARNAYIIENDLPHKIQST